MTLRKTILNQLLLCLAMIPAFADTPITKAQVAAIRLYIKYRTNSQVSYYPKSETGLSHTFEYDPMTKRYFIVLEGDDVYLDSGKKKTVSKALVLKKKKVKLVARAEQTLEMDTELQMTKQFRGYKGLFKTLGICHHQDADKQYHTIYSKLYVPGSLQQLYKKNYTLSFYEMVRAAQNISRGLKTMHKRGIVHRDLGIKNYLIHIPEGKPGRRKIVACIADFGRAVHTATVVTEPRLQGNTTYMAPEGHFFEKLDRAAHKKLDVFALGCVFYRIFNGKKGNWQKKNYVMRDPRPIDVRYKEHKRLVEEGTLYRKEELSKIKNRTDKEEFEFLILRMLDTNPEKRPTAGMVYKRLCRLYKSVDS